MATSEPDGQQGRTAFFYGTLMAPQVLHRVCHGNTNADNPIYASHSFRTRAARLNDFRRHRVKNADYPAILRCQASSVRGTVVTGLTDADIWRLDIFEGDEYTRDTVQVQVLAAHDEIRSGQDADEVETIEAEVYVWKDATGAALEATEWDFDEFTREKLRFWTGQGGQAEGDGAESRNEFKEVDEAVAAQVAEATNAKHDGTGGRGLNGHISSALQEEHTKADLLRNAV